MADVPSHAYEPIDAALGNLHNHTCRLQPVFGYGLLFAAGLVVELMSVGLRRPASRPPTSGASRDGTRLALLIAVGIGLTSSAMANDRRVRGHRGDRAGDRARRLLAGFVADFVVTTGGA